jgi:hypothetical protein
VQRFGGRYRGLPKRRYGVTASSDMSNNEWRGIQLQLLGLNRNHGVIPAKTGIQARFRTSDSPVWLPAFAGNDVVIVAISSDGRV